MSTQPAVFCGIGRRKTASARVRLKPGKGNITVNSVALEAYFGRKTAQMIVRQPLVLTATENRFDIFIKVLGGGIGGQAGAIRHAIARALLKAASADSSIDSLVARLSNKKITDNNRNIDAKEEGSEGGSKDSSGSGGGIGSVREVLREAGCLTRDPRKVERKKVGKHKARKKPQYSKR